jgi:hypothetical protein
MQPQCLGRRGPGLSQLLISIAVLFGTIQSTYAVESTPSLTAKIEATAGQKPVYFEEDGQYVEPVIRLGYSLSPNVTVGLVQGFRHLKKEEESGDYFYPLDSLIRFNIPQLIPTGLSNLKVSGRIQDMFLANVPTSKRNGLVNALSAQVAASLETGALSSFTAVEATQNFYRETRNPDGVSNPNRGIRLSIGSEYAINKKLGAGISYSYLNREMHNGKNQDLFSVNPEMSYQFDKTYGVFIGMDTTDSRLKSFGGAQGPYLYKEDLSEVYMRVECTL